MIKEPDIKAKSDQELLVIWTNQHEYVPEMIVWVKAEIERRGLDIAAIPVRNPQEAEREYHVKSSERLIRGLAVVQGLLGLLGASIAATNLFHAFNVWFIVLLVVSLAVIAFAVGIWKRQRWAVISGLVFYGLVTVMNAVSFVLGGVGLVLVHSNAAVMGLLYALLGLAISAGFASAYNTVRKSLFGAAPKPVDGMVTAGKPG